jgi:hypothetical protein
MDISVVIAQVLGIFFIVAGISMVANSKATMLAIEESVQHKGVLYVWGLLALLTGATIVALNNAWTSGLPLLVTILGWLALIKSAFILWFPGAASSLYRKFNKGGLIVFCGLVAFVLGVILLYW